jgi:hypothetical protein
MTRPRTVDLQTVEQILAEARDQEAQVLSDELPPQSANQALGLVKLQELDGSTVALGTLWEQRPAVLIFLRHYG